MIDPLSLSSVVTEAALVAFKVAKAITVFKSKVRDVDNDIEQLQFQVDGVSSVLSSLDDELKRPEFLTYSASIAQNLLQHLPRTISSCQTTLDAIAARIVKLQTSERRTTLTRSWRAIKLQWGQTEMSELLGRVKGHSVNLQLALSAASL
jgi:Fungal N-terminal domain of STAND proteins